MQGVKIIMDGNPKKLHICVVGMGFGRMFTDIYLAHPDVAKVSVFDTNRELLKQIAQADPRLSVYDSFKQILDDPDLDAVHLVTPIPLHEEQSVTVLESGKHCACTVPMSMSLKGIERIVKAKNASGKKYMMMETSMYTYHFFHVKHLIESGSLGKIQFLRGAHYQEMAGWPGYWRGLPPMYYATHAIAPLVGLAGSKVKSVICLGSGTMDKALTKQYGNPYPLETALLTFENNIKAEVTRSLFETAKEIQEGLFVYGSKQSFEWGFTEYNDPYITTAADTAYTGRGGIFEIYNGGIPVHNEGLPKDLRRFSANIPIDPEDTKRILSAKEGSSHHGSHPHLVHEFVTAIAEDKEPFVSAELAANICAAGICAHESAMKDGKKIDIPQF